MSKGVENLEFEGHAAWEQGSIHCEKLQLFNSQRCQYCIYAVTVSGRGGSALICTHKADSEGNLYLTELKYWCRNFRKQRKIDRPNVKQPENGQIRFIPLTKGQVAIVDAEDYEWLSKYKWHAVKTGDKYYAYRSRNKRSLSMHRMIMNEPKGMIVDHKDGNGLNNRRSNLRVCTTSQNHQNRRRTFGSSRYKGVHWDKKSNKWAAAITDKGKYKFLGHFDDEVEAAKAYDKKASELFGEFAYLNFKTS